MPESRAQQEGGNAMSDKIKAFCGRMCTAACGVLITLKDGEIAKIEGDPDCPLNQGAVCPKGLAFPELIYHPDRLKYPLKRVGNRGEGKWQRISWDEALASISDRMKTFKQQFGAESILLMLGSPKGMELAFAFRLANVYGISNVTTAGDVCHMPRDQAATFTYGAPAFPDLDEPPSCLIVWGSNPLHTHEGSVTTRRLRPAYAKGTKFIVIDPRKDGLASRADMWLKPRPGSDGLLALGMLKAIIDNRLYDAEFVASWTVGFDQLQARLTDYSLEQIAEATWIPRAQIEQAAETYATTRPAAIHWGNALDHTSNNFQTCRAISILRAITGNLDVPGGDCLASMPPLMRPGDFMLVRTFPRNQDKALGNSFRVASRSLLSPRQAVVEAILEQKPYPVKAALIMGTNPLLSYADAQQACEALKRLEFLVVSELFLTPTAELADIVLPVATNFEFNEIGHYGVRLGLVEARHKVIEPPGECWSDMKIINELGKRLGVGEHFWHDENEALDLILEPSGMKFEQFKERGILYGDKKYYKYREDGFRTPSRKVEIYSAQLEAMGYEPLPAYLEPPETPFGSPELYEKYPLVLTSSKNPYFVHSTGRSLASLRRQSPEPVAELNPQTATKLGIKQGDWVYIETPRGRIKQRLQLNEALDPRIIFVAYGWWFPERSVSGLHGWQESNINMLTSGSPLDPALGTPNLRGGLCRVYKAD